VADKRVTEDEIVAEMQDGTLFGVKRSVRVVVAGCAA